MTKSNGLRAYSKKVKRPQGKPFLIVKQGSNKTEKLQWVILLGKKKLGYLKYIAEQNGINMDSKCCRLKDKYDYSEPPTLSDIEIITVQENLKRNSIHRLPKEIQELIRSLIILTKRLNHEPKHYTAYRKKGSYQCY